MILPRPKSRQAIQPRSFPPVIPATHGISIPEPLLLWMAGFFLGADHTKEFLSFEKQPSFFKGRNQSWFHPLRTPSRPGAAAPGPHRGWGQAGGLSHAIDRPRCTDRQLLGVGVLLTSCGVLGTKRSSCHEGGRALPWGRLHEGISVLWETTFAFQRAKPVVVSPFENPFPTRGRGPSIRISI